MKYRLIEIEHQRYLALDHDLLQRPILKCDHSFYPDAIGKLYSEEEINPELWHTDVYAVKTKKSRCCGMCDGYSDICVTDMVCEAHKTTGCELCYGKR